MVAEQYSVPAEGAEPSADPQLGVSNDSQAPGPVSIPEGATRPEGLPENFADVAALAAAHAEATRKITELGQGGPPSDLSVEQLINQAGEDVQASGAVSETTLKALEKAGISEQQTRGFIAGQAALAAQRDSEVMESFGGKAQFEAFVEWAPENLSNEEINALNAMIDSAYQSGDMTNMQMAVQGVMQRFSPEAPRVVSGSAAKTSGALEPYENKYEAMKVIASPAYKSGDKMLHETHARRLALTPGIFN